MCNKKIYQNFLPFFESYMTGWIISKFVYCIINKNILLYIYMKNKKVKTYLIWLFVFIFVIVIGWMMMKRENFDTQKRPVKIVDCFIFYNEMKMLEFRLKELNDSVDYFVLVESTKTFSNKEKPLLYNENKHMFSDYNDKIIHVIIDDFSNMDMSDPYWALESYQRNSISKGIERLNLNDDDIIIISDVDEIPKIKSIPDNLEDRKVHSLKQDLYYYNLNTRCDEPWNDAKVMTYKTFLENDSNPQKIRRNNEGNINIPDGGWHFSYFGDTDFIMNKIKMFSHQELNNDTYNRKDAIEDKIKNSKDLFGRNIAYQHIEINNNKNLPENYSILLDINK